MTVQTHIDSHARKDKLGSYISRIGDAIAFIPDGREEGASGAGRNFIVR
jgi:hypothetical protein